MKTSTRLSFLFCFFPILLSAQLIMPDPNFGTDGFVLQNLAIGYVPIEMEVYPDGSVIAMTTDNFDQFSIYRYLPDGSPDANFGAAGQMTTDFGFSLTYPMDMKVLSNNNLYFLFEVYVWGELVQHSNLAYVRMGTNGEILSSSNVDLFEESYDSFNAIEESTSGGIYICGATDDWLYNGEHISVRGHNASGMYQLNLSTLIGMNGTAHAVANLPGSNYLIAGSFNGQGGIIRRNGYNSFDTSFGNDGFAIQIGGALKKVYVLENDKILAASSNRF
ncbi:MAG: hypothetical protein KDC44_21780 [Phaeodactylibacter sp.]|nr:hypothetical protein [Phaeodactylibacter sp.]